MGNVSIIRELIEKELLELRTGYIGKVLSFDGTTAKIQPLLMTKQYGKPATKHSVVSNVPVIESARYKLGEKTINCGDGIYNEVLTKVPLAAGDLVFCMCADRDITEARRGNFATPPIGHHSISDSVVVGIL
jgi:hypothetical protein